MPRHSAPVQSTTTTTHSFVGLAQPTRPPTGVVIPPRARPVGRPDVGYSESCVMASEDSGAVDGGVGAFSSDAVASLSASVEGLQLSRRRPDFTLPPMHPGLRLSSSAPLVAASEAGGGERVFCDRCRSNRRFFCHACLVPLVDDVPVVRLPFRAYFITDEKEKRSKATGAQCAILAPSQVTLCRPDHLPPLDPRRTVLLFPEKGAMSVEDVVAALAPRRSSDGVDARPEDAAARLSALDAVVIIDSKWDGATLISKSETLRNLPRAMLARHRTAFWRFHPQPKSQRKRDDAASLRAAGEDDGDERLCSLEALYFFAREFHEGGGMTCEDVAAGGTCGCHDDLFWFFAHQHAVVAKSASSREYHPMPPQPRKGRTARRTEARRAAAGGDGDGTRETVGDDRASER